MGKSRRINLTIIILLVILLSGLISGLSIYWWQTKEKDKLKAKLNKTNQRVRELKAKVARLESEAQKEAETPPKEASSPSEKAQSKPTEPQTSKEFGYIKQVYLSGGKNYLDIDYAQMLTGEEATKAAREDGEIGEGEELDMDYYIRNKNPKIRTFAIDEECKISVYTYHMETEGVEKRTLNLTKFRQIFETKDPTNQNMIVNPYRIILKGNTIVEIEEQYLP